MKTKAKTFQIIVWSMLTLAGSNLLAAKEPLYDGLGSYSRKVTTAGQKPGSVELTFSQNKRKPTVLRKRPSTGGAMVSVNGSR
jgi:hypothetical protein